MAPVNNKTIGSTATAILVAADWKTLGTPVSLKNESKEIIYLTIAGADPYDLDPGEVLGVIPGQVITGTAVGGAAKLQIIEGIIPHDESASKGGGSVAAAGSVAAGDGRNKWSVAQGDFTAVYAGPDTLTLGTFPTPLGTPNDGDFSMVVVTDSTGLQRAYFPTANAMTLAGQVLTVAGAAFVTGGSADLDYDVIVWGPPRTYDADANADQVWDVAPEYLHVDSDQQAGASLGDDTYYEYWDVKTYHHIAIQIADTAGAAGSNLYTLEASRTDDGTAQDASGYIDRTQEWLDFASMSSAQLAADPTLGAWEIDVPFEAKFIRVKVVRTGDAANTDGAYQFDAMWS